MPSIHDVYPDKWLKPDKIAGARVPVVIEYARIEKLFNPTARQHEDKIVIKFRGKDLRLIANKTQCLAIADIAKTDDYSRWGSTSVVLSTTKASNGKDTIVINRPNSQTQPQTQQRQAAPASAPERAPAPSHHDDVDFDRVKADESEDFDELWEPNENPPPDARPEGSGARPAAAPSGARPINNANGPCPECHAPVGKMHATSCTAVQEAGARPQTTDSGARPEGSAARPAPARTPLDEIYDSVARITPNMLSESAQEVLRKARNAENDSVTRMSRNYLNALVKLMAENLFADPEHECFLVLTALTGARVSELKPPGQLLHGFVAKPLHDQDGDFIEAMVEILNVCRDYLAEATNGSGPNG